MEANHIRGDLNADAILTDLGFYTGKNVESAQAQQFVGVIRKAAKSASAKTVLVPRRASCRTDRAHRNVATVPLRLRVSCV